MKVLVCDPLAESAVREMKEAGLEVLVKTSLKGDTLMQEIAPFDVVVVRSQTKLTAAVIEAAKNLKLILRAGVGLDNVDAAAAARRNIRVENTPHATTISVAEYTLALMLALARKIPQSYASLKGGQWDRKTFQGVELKGKTLGVIGLGRIGQEVAKRAKAFGMHVEVNDRIHDQEIAEALEIEHFPLERVVAEADFVTLHVPLDETTKHLFDESLMRKMKKGSFLINASRGGIVDEKALVKLLEEGHLSGAAIDVFEEEPLKSDHPLLKMPNVICVPHLGAATHEGQARAGQDAARIIIEFSRQSF